MPAISYSLPYGQPLEQVTSGTLAPAAGTLEIRFDQTATTMTDNSVPGGKRAPKKGEIFELMRILTERLVNDPSVLE